MREKYYLSNLNCANCALKIQDRVAKIDGVSLSFVDVVSNTLTLEVDQGRDIKNIEKQAQALIKAIEPDVVLSKEKESKSQTFNLNHALLIVGAIMFGLALYFDQLVLYVVAYLLVGHDILLKAFKNTINLQWFDENFLMAIATIGAFAIQQYPEAVGVMLFYKVGEYFQDLSVAKSKHEIEKLFDITPEYAVVIKDDEFIKVLPQQVQVDDWVYIKAGERIPVDGIIIEGQSSLNTASLSGESLPVDVELDDEVFAGSINLSAPLKIKVTKTYDQSALAKMIQLIESASMKKAQSEQFITKFAKVYTPIVVMLALLLVVIPVVFMKAPFETWLYRSLVFLVISCPCALVISIPLSYFGGIGSASKQGILIKGSEYLEALVKLDTIVFDKTGTLTKGQFAIADIKSYHGYSENEVLKLAAHLEAHSNHPIAQSIVKAYDQAFDYEVDKVEEVAGFGVIGEVNHQSVLIGNHKLLKQHHIELPTKQGVNTSVYVVVNSVCIGEIEVADEVKADVASGMQALKNQGVSKLMMLSGDKQPVVDDLAQTLNLDVGLGELLPHEKVSIIEKEMQDYPNRKLAFVGDGINDAASLVSADLGIAMGGLGSDIAIEAADIILVSDEPSKVSVAIDIGRKTRKIVYQNIIMALAIKILFLSLGALGLASLWEAVFADVGVALLAILNAMRILR